MVVSLTHCEQQRFHWHFDCARLDWWQSSIEFNTFGFIFVVVLLLLLRVRQFVNFFIGFYCHCFYCYFYLCFSLSLFRFVCCAGKVFVLLSSISILIVTFAPISGCQGVGRGHACESFVYLAMMTLELPPPTFAMIYWPACLASIATLILWERERGKTLKLINII